MVGLVQYAEPVMVMSLPGLLDRRSEVAVVPRHPDSTRASDMLDRARSLARNERRGPGIARQSR
jgi:hypothetical protein